MREADRNDESTTNAWLGQLLLDNRTSAVYTNTYAPLVDYKFKAMQQRLARKV